MVLPQNELSDHCKIVTEFNHGMSFNQPISDNYNWIANNNNFKWDDNKSTEFRNCLDQLHGDIYEIKQRLQAGLIESSGKRLQKLFATATSNILIKKKIKLKMLINLKSGLTKIARN